MSPNLERVNASDQEPERDFRILVVDDDSGLRSMLSEFFRAKEGWIVDTASNGDEGLERIRNSRPSYDVVVTDWRMPGQSGLAMTREARVASPETDFVLMSGDEGAEISSEAWWTMKGFRLAVPKPFDPSMMVESIKQILQDRKKLMAT